MKNGPPNVLADPQEPQQVYGQSCPEQKNNGTGIMTDRGLWFPSVHQAIQHISDITNAVAKYSSEIIYPPNQPAHNQMQNSDNLGNFKYSGTPQVEYPVSETTFNSMQSSSQQGKFEYIPPSRIEYATEPICHIYSSNQWTGQNQSHGANNPQHQFQPKYHPPIGAYQYYTNQPPYQNISSSITNRYPSPFSLLAMPTYTQNSNNRAKFAPERVQIEPISNSSNRNNGWNKKKAKFPKKSEMDIKVTIAPESGKKTEANKKNEFAYDSNSFPPLGNSEPSCSKKECEPSKEAKQKNDKTKKELDEPNPQSSKSVYKYSEVNNSSGVIKKYSTVRAINQEKCNERKSEIEPAKPLFSDVILPARKSTTESPKPNEWTIVVNKRRNFAPVYSQIEKKSNPCEITKLQELKKENKAVDVKELELEKELEVKKSDEAPSKKIRNKPKKQKKEKVYVKPPKTEKNLKKKLKKLKKEEKRREEAAKWDEKSKKEAEIVYLRPEAELQQIPLNVELKIQKYPEELLNSTSLEVPKNKKEQSKNKKKKNKNSNTIKDCSDHRENQQIRTNHRSCSINDKTFVICSTEGIITAEDLIRNGLHLTDEDFSGAYTKKSDKEGVSGKWVNRTAKHRNYFTELMELNANTEHGNYFLSQTLMGQETKDKKMRIISVVNIFERLKQCDNHPDELHVIEMSLKCEKQNEYKSVMFCCTCLDLITTISGPMEYYLQFLRTQYHMGTFQRLTCNELNRLCGDFDPDSTQIRPFKRAPFSLKRNDLQLIGLVSGQTALICDCECPRKVNWIISYSSPVKNEYLSEKMCNHCYQERIKKYNFVMAQTITKLKSRGFEGIYRQQVIQFAEKKINGHKIPFNTQEFFMIMDVFDIEIEELLSEDLQNQHMEIIIDLLKEMNVSYEIFLKIREIRRIELKNRTHEPIIQHIQKYEECNPYLEMIYFNRFISTSWATLFFLGLRKNSKIDMIRFDKVALSKIDFFIDNNTFKSWYRPD